MKSFLSNSIRFALVTQFALIAAASHAQWVATDLHPSTARDTWSYGGGAQQAGYTQTLGGDYHAVAWSGSNSTMVDLNPAGFTSSFAYKGSGGRQIGFGNGSATGGNDHAIVWSGSASSFVDINPTWVDNSVGQGIEGTNAVGYGTLGSSFRAILWSGLNSASAIDLTPAGFDYAFATNISGGSQIGYGSATSTSNFDHAILWNGSSSSAVDLGPAGMTFSYGYGVSGGQQVGVAYDNSFNSYAALWSGSAASYVNLNPAGSAAAVAYDVRDGVQVGVAYYGSSSKATLWTGSAASAVDLHSFLPSGYVSSEAWGFSDDGSILGYAVTSTGRAHAIMWSQPVPEPASMFALAVGGLGLLRRRSSKQK